MIPVSCVSKSGVLYHGVAFSASRTLLIRGRCMPGVSLHIDPNGHALHQRRLICCELEVRVLKDGSCEASEPNRYAVNRGEKISLTAPS